MLEKPAVAEDELATCLTTTFGPAVSELTFLPLGADLDTAVYRVFAADGRAYFLKLRRGDLNRAAVLVPRLLHQQGITQIIPSLPTLAGEPWAALGDYKLILYPFIEGRDGFAAGMNPDRWRTFGAALRRFHDALLPADATAGVPSETFSDQWRQSVRGHLARIERDQFSEPAAAEPAGFLRSKRDETLDLLQRAERHARTLQAQPPPFILCHGDIHAWNLLIDATGALYIVDWDTLIYAPNERDLMFIGAGLGNSGLTPAEESHYFYQGYGPLEPDPVALAYYRYDRIIEDIALYCDQLLLSAAGGNDRRQALAYLKSNYLPGGPIDVARRSDPGA